MSKKIDEEMEFQNFIKRMQEYSKTLQQVPITCLLLHI